MEHVKFRVNHRGPPRKAKYSCVTDRELVPRGNGEKNPGRGVKENLKPCVYKLWDTVKGEPRTFCRTVRRVIVTGEVNHRK